MGETVTVIVRKLHGWGNDFLVALDADQPDGPLDASALQELAPRLCDRRRGVGADGLIHGATPADSGAGAGSGGTADVVMSLFNAGGGRAEMSGNGIRCLAHAVALAGGHWRDQVVIDTDVGRRELVFRRVGASGLAGHAGADRGLVGRKV